MEGGGRDRELVMGLSVLSVCSTPTLFKIDDPWVPLDKQLLDLSPVECSEVFAASKGLAALLGL